MTNIVELSNRVEAAKTSYAQALAERNIAESKIKELLSQLKEEFGVSTIKEAQELLSSMNKDIDSMSKDIEIKLAELEK